MSRQPGITFLSRGIVANADRISQRTAGFPPKSLTSRGPARYGRSRFLQPQTQPLPVTNPSRTRQQTGCPVENSPRHGIVRVRFCSDFYSGWHTQNVKKRYQPVQNGCHFRTWLKTPTRQSTVLLFIKHNGSYLHALSGGRAHPRRVYQYQPAATHLNNRHIRYNRTPAVTFTATHSSPPHSDFSLAFDVHFARAKHL